MSPIPDWIQEVVDNAKKELSEGTTEERPQNASKEPSSQTMDAMVLNQALRVMEQAKRKYF